MPYTYYLLIIFAALARDKQYVPLAEQADGILGGHLPVAYCHIGRARLGEPSLYHFDYVAGVLEARIVGGNYNEVGVAPRGLPHQGALEGVAVAAAAEQTVELAFAQPPQRGQALFKPVGSVSEIDENLPAVVRGDPLQPARHAPEIAEGFTVIRNIAGAVAPKSAELIVSGLVKYGLKALEVSYPSHNETEEKTLKALAIKYRLIPTAGSDFHYESSDSYNASFVPKMDEADVMKLLKQNRTH